MQSQREKAQLFTGAMLSRILSYAKLILVRSSHQIERPTFIDTIMHSVDNRFDGE